jgi:hypothetical protein
MVINNYLFVPILKILLSIKSVLAKVGVNTKLHMSKISPVFIIKDIKLSLLYKLILNVKLNK